MGLWAGPAIAACELEVLVYFDISGSTSPRIYLGQFLDLLAQLPEKPQVEIIPFGNEVYDPCRKLSLLDWAPGTFPARCQFGQIRADLDQPGGQEYLAKTDLLGLADHLKDRVEEAVVDGKRRAIVVFSDFVQSDSSTPRLSSLSWINLNEERLSRLASSLATSASRLIMVSQPPNPGFESHATEISDFRAFLRGAKFNLWEAELNLGGGFREEIEEESTPLTLAIVGVAADKLQVEVGNPACSDRSELTYRLARVDGRESKGLGSGGLPDSCPEKKLAAGERKICVLEVGVLPQNEECPRYELHVRPSYQRAAAKSEPFTGAPCFKLQAVTLDISPNGGRATLPPACLSDDLETWEAADIGTPDKDRVGFAACIEARGLLARGTKKSYSFGEVTSSASPVKMGSRPIDMDRFSGVLRAPGLPRFFPIFVTLSREEARTLCFNAHEEKPSRMTISGAGFQKLTLYRSRDRASEEILHNAWESLLFPLGGLLLFVTLAVRGARRSSSGALEEYLGILTFGVLAIAAVLHDVTNLGDDLEQKFSRRPNLYTGWGLVALASFFVYWVLRGAFDPRRPKAVAAIEFGRVRLARRTFWFWFRSILWLLAIGGIAGWTGLRVRSDPKRLEECHFEGRIDFGDEAPP